MKADEETELSHTLSKLRRVFSYLSNLLHSKSSSLAEAQDVIERAQRSGLLNFDVLPMLEGIFRVTDMRVRDIMVSRSKMIVISDQSSLDDILKTMISSGHSRFPVIGDDLDDIRGTLLAKDLLPILAKHQQELQLDDYIRQAVLVPQSKRLNTLLREFRKSRNHMAIVIDEYGGVCGLVTIEDVLEQIVGDISDEHDQPEEHYIYKHDNHSYEIQALTPVEYFNRYFSSEINSEADTIGGFVIERLGHTPDKSESLKSDGFLFKVSQSDSRRIHSLEVKKIDIDD